MSFSFYSRTKPKQSQIGMTDWSQYQSKPAQTQSQPYGIPQTPKGILESAMKIPGTVSTAPKTSLPTWRTPSQPISQPTKPPAASPPPAGSPPPSAAPAVQPTGYDAVLARMKALAEQRQAGEDTRTAAALEQMRQAEAEREGRRQKQIEGLQGYRDKAIQNIMAGIPEQEKLTAEQKAGIEDVYGQQARTDIRRQQEEQAGIQRTFAGLGALDSSVFQQQAAKSAQSATERASMADRAKQAEIARADRDLYNAKRQAQSLVDEEMANFDQALIAIENTYAQGSQEYNKAVNDLIAKSQDNIYGLQQDILKMELDIEQKKADAAKKSSTTEADLQQKSQAAIDTTNLIDDILSRDLAPVTGVLRIRGSIPGTEAYTTNQKLTQLKNNLALAARGQLKGQGAVSDFESKILMNSVAALNGAQREEDVRAELERLKMQLGRDILGGQTSATQYTPSTGNIITAPDGQQIELVD